MEAGLIWDLHLTLQKMRMNICASTDLGCEQGWRPQNCLSYPLSGFVFRSSPHRNQPGESDLGGTLISLSGRQEGKPAEPEGSELRLRNASHFSSFTFFYLPHREAGGKWREQEREEGLAWQGLEKSTLEKPWHGPGTYLLLCE